MQFTADFLLSVSAIRVFNGNNTEGLSLSKLPDFDQQIYGNLYRMTQFKWIVSDDFGSPQTNLYNSNISPFFTVIGGSLA